MTPAEFTMCPNCASSGCGSACRRYGTPNCRKSLFEVGRCLIDDNEHVLALKYLELAADRLFPDAYRLIGDCYRLGLGVAVDTAKAVQYYKLARCQPSFYGPMIAEAEKTKVVSSTVKPVSSVPLGELSEEDASSIPRYFERNGCIGGVEQWYDCLLELSRILSAEDAEGLFEFVEHDANGRMSLVPECGSDGKYKLIIDDSMESAESLALILKLRDRFPAVVSCVKIWMEAKGAVIAMRVVPPKIEGEKVGKKSDKVARKKKRHGSAGTPPGRHFDHASKARDFAAPVEHDAYAHKGIGFAVRDNGRYGSLPMYDDMNG